MIKAAILALAATLLVCGEANAADPALQQLPSQEVTVPPEAERGPKVISNPHPTKTDELGATQVQDSNPATVESVEESPLSTRLATPPTTNPKFKVKAAKERKTMALALGGGGARGAAHIGVLRVLERENIPIDYIVGNSMGSVIGGLYSSGVPLDKLESLGLKGGMRKHYLPDVTTRVLMMPLAKLTQPLRKKRLAGIFSGSKFERYLVTLIPKNANDMEKLVIPFSAVATNLVDGKAYRISEGKLSTAIRASASISPLLRPVRIGDKIYTDGGVRANLPASSARDTGAEVVIAVVVDEPLRELPEKDFTTFKGITTRLGDIVLAVTDEHQLQFADIVINPDVSGIPILSNDPQDTEKAIKAGEAATLKALPLIRKKMGMPEGSRVVESGDRRLQ